MPDTNNLISGATKILVLLALVALPTLGFAWSMSGHRVIADIAWLHLSPKARQAAWDLLQQHPDFRGGFLALMPEDVPAVTRPRWLFRHAAAWPDVVRGYDETDPKRHRRFHRGPWHYINTILWADAAAQQQWADQVRINLATDPPSQPTEDMNVVQAIKLHIARLGAPQAPATDRALSLAWLLHLVADLHQPLHSTALFGLPGVEAGGDRGGNQICLSGLEEVDNLHWFWDSRVFMNDEPAALEARTLQLLSQEAPSTAGGAATLEVDAWVAESAALAREVVYTPELVAAARQAVNGKDCEEPDAGRVPLSLEYIERAQATAEKRAVQAGVRLAMVIEGALR